MPPENLIADRISERLTPLLGEVLQHILRIHTFETLQLFAKIIPFDFNSLLQIGAFLWYTFRCTFFYIYIYIIYIYIIISIF